MISILGAQIQVGSFVLLNGLVRGTVVEASDTLVKVRVYGPDYRTRPAIRHLSRAPGCAACGWRMSNGAEDLGKLRRIKVIT